MTGGVEQQAEAAAKKAEGVAGKVIALMDHVWHELETGDLMTWLAFAAVFLAFVIFAGVWRGSITWKKGG